MRHSDHRNIRLEIVPVHAAEFNVRIEEVRKILRGEKRARGRENGLFIDLLKNKELPLYLS